MLSKTEYRNAYLNTYSNKNEKINQKSNINFLYLISLLSVPIIFTCVLGIFFDKIGHISKIFLPSSMILWA